MAIDTERKRKSIVSIGQRQVGPGVVPDGSFDQADRQAIGYSYAGIAAEGGVNVFPLVNNKGIISSLVNGGLVN
jgi:hypothetical protein